MRCFRRFISAALFALLALNLTPADAKEIGLFIQEQPVSFNGAPPFIKNGTTMVPLRTVTESFGLKLDWDQSTRSIQLTGANVHIKLTIDEPRGEVNRKQITLPQPPTIVSDRTYVPLRFVGEQLNKSVEWEPEQSNIFISNSQFESDQYWLAKLVEAEASGEPYQGKVAVAAVVINRSKSPFFPKSIKSVIFERQQFTPVHTRRIYAMQAKTDTVKAVSEALNGVDPTNGALYFHNPQKSNNRFLAGRSTTSVIGNHRFAR
ncbi:hypothetical protein BEP19_16640 [Ammoniphilus oxalaticus]|uniref:Copper amine oxidase n=1 Tax=Ammoniphilus oxalaticus TaxID=66863 RepID=A0A419SQV4_9BACL|nr:cell wall hydrolase [Ammoniphilus oxalaticus]RKD26821.1 hypothetical protein BEP19_16640 [Ammoniphilus oxalaticus]